MKNFDQECGDAMGRLCRSRVMIGSTILIILHGVLLISSSSVAVKNGSGPGPILQSRKVDMRVEFKIQEDVPIGTSVGYIPTKVGFTYRFNENVEEFELNGTSGEIRSKAVIDREALSADYFDLVVLSSQPTYPLEVRIYVEDINDNAPKFPEDEISVTFSESATAGTRVFLDAAKDLDDGENDVTTNYKIVDGNEENHFHLSVITNPSGETPYLYLETTGKLDRETIALYLLNISAEDGGSPPKFGYLSVHVTIIDVNDNGPIFDHSDYVVSLNESVPMGTKVLQVTATDNDEGENAKITYYLAEDEKQFSVHPETGVISTMQPVKCPQSCSTQQLQGCPKSCVFTVFARDHGVPRQDGRTYITVNLLDENDHDPVIRFRYFPSTASSATVDENANNGSVVAAISVLDFDEGLNGDTTVEIISGNELKHFRLESTPSFQLLRTNGALDRENIGKYNLTIVARDKGSPPRSSTSFLIIEVNDVNDHEPVFERSEYSAVLHETIPLGSYVASIRATDEDTGINSQIFYSIVEGNERMWFDIDPNSGLLTTKSNLDREQQGTLRLKISARDGGPNPKWAHTQIKITIQDENDEKPVFAEPAVNITLPENITPGSVVYKLIAVDHDQGTNGSVSYLLSEETEHTYPSTFHVDKSSGKVSIRKSLDRESTPYINVTVLARDHGSPPLSSSASIFITLGDINDNQPKFIQAEDPVPISEMNGVQLEPVKYKEDKSLYLSYGSGNHLVNYFVAINRTASVGSKVTEVKAIDMDEGSNGLVAYSILSGAQGYFDIGRTDGIIRLKKNLRLTEQKEFDLKVLAKDHGEESKSDYAMVKILVTLTHFNNIKFEKELYTFKVEESSQLEDKIENLGELKVLGKPQYQFKYSIIGGDSYGLFSVGESNGLLQVVKTLDREQQANYYLTVIAQKQLHYGHCVVHVQVGDINDNVPKFDDVQRFASAKENAPIGSELLVAHAEDQDIGENAEVLYSLRKNPQQLFTINPTTGLVSLANSLKYAESYKMTIEVTASNRNSKLSSRQTIHFTVEDVNDHTPVFDHSSYETSLLETTPVNSRFFSLTATDQDVEENARIFYTIAEGNEANRFGIFPDGYLFVKKELDREEQDYFSLMVVAEDNGEPKRFSSISVIVHVIDTNDNAPAFVNATFNFAIDENEVSGTYIGKVTAVDLDSGRNSELTYTLSNLQNDFYIDPKNGYVKSKRSFDRESMIETLGKDTLTLDVMVQDGGEKRLKDEAQINIQVMDVNDNAPIFAKPVYHAQILEGMPINSPLILVTATDLDEGRNGNIVYSISDGNDDDIFTIDSTTGQIFLSKTLDRESKDEYDLQVTAVDTGESVQLSSTARVSFEILDENDNAPEFTHSDASVSVLETTRVFTKLMSFQALDPDLGVNREVFLSITGGNRHETFRIDSKSGSLYLNKPLDYEKYTSYKLNITASDNGDPKLSSSIEFLVMVQDCNDNPPVFPSTAIVRQIQENIAINTPIVTVFAEDPDSGLNGQVRYYIKDQDPSGNHFGIDEERGTIHTLKEIDREFVDTFKLNVIAVDQAEPTSSRLSSQKLVTVIVEDTNDNEPKFVSMNAAVLPTKSDRSVNHENNKYPEICQVVAMDDDSGSNGEVSYEIINGDISLFKLNRNTGSLTLQSPISSLLPRYQLTIRATDEAIQSQRKSSELYLTLIGANTKGEKPLTFSSSGYEGAVYENEPAGTSVLTVQCSDRVDNIEYYITNVTSAATGKQLSRWFDIDTKRGLVFTVSVLNREIIADKLILQVYAVALNSGKVRTASTQVEVEILDKNDCPPEFERRKEVLELSENASVGQLVTTVTAYDQDTIGTIKYSLVDEGTDKFMIDEDSAQLRVRSPLDREEKEEYQLVVRASDGIQHSDLQLNVQILDMNDNAAVFSQQIYSFDIPENYSPGEQVGKIEAIDADKGINGRLSYSILSSWGTEKFALNPDSGVFTLTSKLDYEDIQHYIFVVQAQDSGKPSLSSTATVYLNVLDLNDNAPQFVKDYQSSKIASQLDSNLPQEIKAATYDPNAYNKLIFENVSIGTSILTVSATDGDSGPNGELFYSISSGNENNVFDISRNGTIFTTKRLNREEKPYYILKVKATDEGFPDELSSSAQVNIILEDVNDESPRFISPNETTVPENSPINSVLMMIKAVDRDDGRNGYVEYSLLNHNETFSLGPVDGLLRVIANIDREMTNNFKLQILAKDRGEDQRSTRQDLFVKVLDSNDNAPMFDPRQYSASLAENASVGMSVLQVSATDIDEGANAQIRYAVIAGDPNRDFNIDEDSGVIRLSKRLNYERKRAYILTVQAEDSGKEVRYDTSTVAISVTDINDNAPKFLDSPYLAYVRENVEQVPASVLFVTAYDADSAENNHQLRYLMQDGDKNSFRVNASTGEITVHRSLDRERQAEYQFTVIAMDAGTPRLTGAGIVKIIVEDANDNSPRFTLSKFEFFIEENVPVESYVGSVVAEDLDDGLNAAIRYNILYDPVGCKEQQCPFEIMENTGEIYTTRPIDREVKETYSFRVKASDQNPVQPRIGITNVTITVLDLNDNVPKFEQANLINNVRKVKIPDSILPGEYVLGVSAKDSDAGLNGRVRYSISGVNANKFSINEETGVVKLLRRLGNEKKLNFMINAVDSSVSSPLSVTMAVEVEKISSHLFPTYQRAKREFKFNENENNKIVTRLQGEKSHYSQYNYFIGGGNLGNAFEVERTSGIVKIGSEGLDYETSKTYELWVEMCHTDTPDFRAAMSLEINVTDINDNAPVFRNRSYSFNVMEEEYGPQLVGQVTADDLDSGKNAKINYYFSKENDPSFRDVFSIDKNSGEIRTKIKLDRESISNYLMVVEATDQGFPRATGTTTVFISVDDKNDNPPRFTRLFSVNVTENAEIGSFVIRVTSVDKDIKENANCSYSLSDDGHGKFKIDALSGNITVSGLLDRETQDEYLLKVSAIDGSWRAETLVTVTIQDMNDNSPVFEYSFYNFNIPEGNRPVTFVGQVTATDRDKRGPNSVVSYSLKHQSDFFTVDPVSGEVFSKKPLSYKKGRKRFSPENEHEIIVVATDSGRPPMSSECSVTINVVNANNHPPQFKQKEYFTPVLKHFGVGTKIVKVDAEDPLDFGVNAELEYFTIGGNASQLFSIEKRSGWVKLTKDLANVPGRMFTLNVRTMDKGIPPQSDDATVQLFVTEENAHAPIFSAKSYRVIVPENEVVGSSIVTVAAKDQDQGPNGRIVYTISKGNEKEKFVIDRETGAISINEELDYDTVKEYRLSIIAKDLGYHSKSSEAELTVILTDVNDNAPSFLFPNRKVKGGTKKSEKAVYSASIKEQAPIGTEVIQLNAEDKDSPKNSIIQFAIVGGSGKNVFKIDSESGVIQSGQVFDYESEQSYTLEVLASNPGTNLHETATVEVSVESGNEFYPKFVQPVFQFSVSESAPIGSQIGIIQATDEDLGPDGVIYYLLVGASNDRGFSIVPTTGEIIISKNLDRESQSRIVITALAKNYGPIRGNDTDEAQIIITVQDGNDPPVFEKQFYSMEISEDVPVNSQILTVKATDIDVRPSNKRFSYKIISGNSNSSFQIDPLTGMISSSKILDREKQASYTLTVGAVDMGQPPQTGTTKVTVQLLDVNDNGPVIIDRSKEGSIFENEPIGTKVMTLHAEDLDLPPNGLPFSYELVPAGNGKKFRLDKASGVLTTMVELDREQHADLKLLVDVSDNGNPPIRNRQDVTVKVLDRNDSPSQPRNSKVLVFLYKDMLPFKYIADVRPIDPDTTGNYKCRIADVESIKYFRIDESCKLKLLSIPKSERANLRVFGEDGVHSEVKSTFSIEFRSFDNSTLENLLMIRVKNMDKAKFLRSFYFKFLSLSKAMLKMDVTIYNMISSGPDLDLLIASLNSNQNYVSLASIMQSFKDNKARLESGLGLKMLVDFSQCESNDVCHNGGLCSQTIIAHNENQLISGGDQIILSSTDIRLEFQCQCLPGFTGERCNYKKEPCKPNPCFGGAHCTQEGHDFYCSCPSDRAGKTCELERNNACQSNPCMNGGSCQSSSHADSSYFCLCRPGFLGKKCQTVSDICKPNPCLNGGQCLNHAASNSAYPKCKCTKNFYGEHCEKSAFGFGVGSYMTFDELDTNTNDISITFSTTKKNSVLVYDYGKQTGGRSDFIALQIVDGHAAFSYGGSRTAISTIKVRKFVADGKWYRIIATRNSRIVSLTVSSCHHSGEICENCSPGNASCYVNDLGPTGSLNFNGQPLLIGGVKDVEDLFERPGQIVSDDFIGCIHSVVVNGRSLNMSSPAESRGISDTCHDFEGICRKNKHHCGSEGRCIDLWDSHICDCNGIRSPNCDEAFLQYSFSNGASVEFKIGEKYRRGQLVHFMSSNDNTESTKSISFSFRTSLQNAVLFQSATGNDYTVLELESGWLKYSSKAGNNYPVQLVIEDRDLADGLHHSIELKEAKRIIRIIIDGEFEGEELDAASSHDFLDPYLTELRLGGVNENHYIRTNQIVNGFTGCISALTVNNEVQPLNGSGSLFDEAVMLGKITKGCNSAVTGASTAPDPLSIGITLVIVFFVILLIAISVSFVVFRLRKREKTPLPSITPTNKQSPSMTQNPGDVVRSHMMEGEADALRNLVRNSKKISAPTNKSHYQKPDIIERTTSTANHNNNSSSNSPTNNNSSGNGTILNSSGNGMVSMDSELPEYPEHYDLENASSIAPSDIDIVYHYKGFRDNLGHRPKSSPFRHNHHFSGSIQSPGMRHSPLSNVLKSTPLARLSPSSELSQQTTPRILTLQDISGKPLQSALLASAQKDVMSQSERSLNVSQSSSRSSIVNPSSQGTKKKRKKCGERVVPEGASSMAIGLTAEDIDRLNSSRHKNNSSLVSTLDVVSSSESEDRRKEKLSDLLEANTEMLQRARDTSTEEDESGHDSFSCSEFEYGNEKREFRNAPRMIFPKRTDEGDDSFRGSLSTLVASDDDMTYMNGYPKNNGGELPVTTNNAAPPVGWDYLLNWGPNFENLVGVFKDIANLPDNNASHMESMGDSSGNNLSSNSNNHSSTSRSSRYSTPRPTEEYV